MDTSLPDLLHLPEVPLQIFSRSPLVLTLCQVRFAKIFSVANPAFVAEFQRAIEAQYPIANREGVELEISVGIAESQVMDKSASHRWRFSDGEDNWTVVLAEDFVALETREYEHFDDFLNRLREVLEALVQHVRPKIGTRIGLRYINEIRLERGDWSGFICDELLGPLLNQRLVANVAQVQSMQQLLLRYPNNEGISIRYGLLPGGTTVKPRSGEQPANTPFYLLDFDAYRTFPLPAGLSMEPNAICHYVESYNKAVYRLYRWATTDYYISTLGRRQQDEDR